MGKSEDLTLLKLEGFEEGEESTLIRQIQSELKSSQVFIKEKWASWNTRLKLYNNQRRDKGAIGDPLLFTIHQTILSSIYDDKIKVSFEPREGGDVEVAENLNHLAIYDYKLMKMDQIEYEWDWDTLFFGRGLCMLMEFDGKKKCPIPEIIDPLTFYRDPDAKNVNGDVGGRNGSRFWGREILLNLNELHSNDNYFNIENLDKRTTGYSKEVCLNKQARNDAQGKTSANLEIEGENRQYGLTEWFTLWKGKRHLITLANNGKLIVRKQELKTDYWPLIDRACFPMAHDWDGVSVADLVEDKQRARAKIHNLMLKGIESRLYPMYLFDKSRIKNPAMLKFGFNKFIPIHGATSGAIETIQRDPIKQEAQVILDILQAGAEKAAATPELRQGIAQKGEHTATDIALQQKNVDTRYSLKAKIFGWSEADFWEQYYKSYKDNFTAGLGKKIIRLKGVLGTTFRPLKKDNITMKVDPDILIESQTLSEAKRMNDLTAYREFFQYAMGDDSMDRRYASKKYLQLLKWETDEIEMIMPKSSEEYIAEQENEQINNGKMPSITIKDNHIEHLQIHKKAIENDIKKSHIQTHLAALYLQKDNPPLQPQQLQQPVVGMGGQPPPEQTLPSSPKQLKQPETEEKQTPQNYFYDSYPTKNDT